MPENSQNSAAFSYKKVREQEPHSTGTRTTKKSVTTPGKQTRDHQGFVPSQQMTTKGATSARIHLTQDNTSTEKVPTEKVETNKTGTPRATPTDKMATDSANKLQHNQPTGNIATERADAMVSTGCGLAVDKM